MGPDAGAKYMVCNADEMEPGTFKDRLLMEQVPHQLIEAMLIAAYAIQATTGYIFLRGEYVTAEKRLNEALDAARAAGSSARTSSAVRGASSCTFTPAPAATSAAKKPP